MTDTMRTHIEVEGVILTPEALEMLRIWQENDNRMLHVATENLADAVCILARTQDSLMDKWLEESKNLIIDLSIVRDYLKSFKKP